MNTPGGSPSRAPSLSEDEMGGEHGENLAELVLPAAEGRARTGA